MTQHSLIPRKQFLTEISVVLQLKTKPLPIMARFGITQTVQPHK